MAEPRWTAIVAEDEPLLRQELLDRLAEAWPGLDVLAACEDGASAVEALAEHQPDVAFLDIRMPGLTGIEVAQSAAETSPRTQVVFVTAYDQYAVDAFEQGAIDYLLKPIAGDRLAATVQRLQARSGDTQAVATLLQRLEGRLSEGALPAAGVGPGLAVQRGVAVVEAIAVAGAAQLHAEQRQREGQQDKEFVHGRPPTCCGTGP